MQAGGGVDYCFGARQVQVFSRRAATLLFNTTRLLLVLFDTTRKSPSPQPYEPPSTRAAIPHGADRCDRRATGPHRDTVRGNIRANESRAATSDWHWGIAECNSDVGVTRPPTSTHHSCTVLMWLEKIRESAVSVRQRRPCLQYGRWHGHGLTTATSRPCPSKSGLWRSSAVDA